MKLLLLGRRTGFGVAEGVWGGRGLVIAAALVGRKGVIRPYCELLLCLKFLSPGWRFHCSQMPR
jgi:hypothetical protein